MQKNHAPSQKPSKKKLDFDKIYSKGIAFYSENLTLRVLSTGKNEIRIGFVVSKKVSMLAVVRNKIKRRLRASTNNLLANLNSGYDIIVSVNKDFSKSTPENFAKELRLLLRKANLINEK